MRFPSAEGANSSAASATPWGFSRPHAARAEGSRKWPGIRDSRVATPGGAGSIL